MAWRLDVADDSARWHAVDDLIERVLMGNDMGYDDIAAAGDAAGLMPIQVSAPQGKLLHLLVRMCGAERVLEIGTLAGYSATWMARALPPDGRLVSLEVDPAAAEVARANFGRTGVGDRAMVILGPAAETLATLPTDEPFDFVFIDADKQGYPDYLRLVLPLLRTGSVIVADNVVRQGAVADDNSDDDRVLGVQEFLRLVGDEDRLDATVIQTVGAKGYDGFLLAVLR